MTKRYVPLGLLRPSDTPKEMVVEFYSLLNNEEFRNMQIPQVWVIERELIISDGNNYSTFMAYKGKKEIEVDLLSAKDYPIFEEEIELTRRDAYILRKLRVKSPYDLVQLVDWKRIENKLELIDNSKYGSKSAVMH